MACSNAHLALFARDHGHFNGTGYQLLLRRDEIEVYRLLKRFQLSGLRHHFFAFFDGLLDRAYHVERGFWQIIILAFDNAFEALDRIFDGDEHARRAGENFGDVEWLREETLNLTRAGNGEFVVFRELVHAQDRDNVLQGFIGLQGLLNARRDRVMLFADNAWVQNT